MTELDPSNSGSKPSGPAAAYGSYSSFRAVIERMRAGGIPPVVDRSFFGNQSGSLTAQQRGQLRFLQLIDDDFVPTEQLKDIASSESDDEMKARLAQSASLAYSAQVQLAAVNGTQGQLEESFRRTGLSGQTIWRAVSFYLSLAEDLGLPVSPHFKRSAPPAPSLRKPRKKHLPPPKPGAAEVEDAAAPAPPTPDGQKAAYVTMLMDLAKDSTEPSTQKDMLDRIERALGLAASGGSGVSE